MQSRGSALNAPSPLAIVDRLERGLADLRGVLPVVDNALVPWDRLIGLKTAERLRALSDWGRRGQAAPAFYRRGQAAPAFWPDGRSRGSLASLRGRRRAAA
jgi:hypothetical protein